MRTCAAVCAGMGVVLLAMGEDTYGLTMLAVAALALAGKAVIWYSDRKRGH